MAPGIAVGEALAKNGHSVTFVISRKAVDSRLSEKYAGFRFEKVPGCGFSLSPKKLARFAVEQRGAVRACRRLIESEGADAAIAFGGFNSFGLAVAAILSKTPLILHEANRKPGKAVRFFGRFAARVYVPHGVKMRDGAQGAVRQAGYPIRDEIRRMPRDESLRHFGFGPGANPVLVCGGSQGAAALNEWAFENFSALAAMGLDVLCITGPGKSAAAPAPVADKNGVLREFRQVEFCDRMELAMSSAEMVVARAGAGSIAEFARCSTIPLLVPLPTSADDHQTENARHVEKNGAGICVRQSEISTLLGEVEELASNPGLRAKMRANLERLDELNSSSHMISDIEAIAASGRAE